MVEYVDLQQNFHLKFICLLETYVMLHNMWHNVLQLFQILIHVWNVIMICEFNKTKQWSKWIRYWSTQNLKKLEKCRKFLSEKNSLNLCFKWNEKYETNMEENAA